MSDSDDNEKDSDIIRFPSLEERKARDVEKEAQKERWRAAYQAEMQAGRARRAAHKSSFFNFDNLPLATRCLMFSFILIHVVRAFLLPESWQIQSLIWFSYIPGRFTGVVPWDWSYLLGPFTYAFLHGGWMHLFVNSVMMVAFGVFYERLAGAKGLLIMFFVTSLGGALLYGVMSPNSMVPVVGASGGLSGLFAAFMITMYQRRSMPPMAQKLAQYGVWPMLGFWLVLMVAIGMLMGDVAWQAHIGGYISGIAYIMIQHKGRLG